MNKKLKSEKDKERKKKNYFFLSKVTRNKTLIWSASRYLIALIFQFIIVPPTPKKKFEGNVFHMLLQYPRSTNFHISDNCYFSMN